MSRAADNTLLVERFTSPGQGRCRICDGPGLDVPWELLAGENPGPLVMQIGFRRHGVTEQMALRQAMLDDNGVWRCLVCLREVPAARVTMGAPPTHGWISGSVAMFGGHECLGCGQDAREDR